MIRINDHLIRVDIVRHIWIETDGIRYVLFVDLDGQDTYIAMPTIDRSVAEAMLDKVQKEIERLYLGDDYEEEPTT